MHVAILSCPVLSCPVLSCPVLSCPVLSCPVLSCHVMSWFSLYRSIVSWNWVCDAALQNLTCLICKLNDLSFQPYTAPNSPLLSLVTLALPRVWPRHSSVKRPAPYTATQALTAKEQLIKQDASAKQMDSGAFRARTVKVCQDFIAFSFDFIAFIAFSSFLACLVNKLKNDIKHKTLQYWIKNYLGVL